MTDAIDGVSLVPLEVIADERGAVLHMLRADAAHFHGFGEVYFSEVRPGVVKGWKLHRRMTQRFAAPVGRVRIVLYDDRPDSPTAGRRAVHALGRPDAYALLIIPPRLWYAVQGLGDSPALLANCTDLPHDPAETERREPDSGPVPYDWRRL